MNFVLALDQGTSSSRAIIFDHTGQIVSAAQRETLQIFPSAGWVEHDPWDIWNTQLEVAKIAIDQARLTAADIAAIGITNQRETTLIWDRETGQPIGNAIVWQDRRTACFCDKLKADGHIELIRSKTGLEIDAYFSAGKIDWMLNNIPHAREKANRGELAYGTVDSWLIWNLTKPENGNSSPLHVTDVSNASRSMLFNLESMEFDDSLLQLMNIPQELLPSIVDSSGIVGRTATHLFGRQIPIAGIAGDQQAALFGQGCFSPGLAKNTYGTGCFMLMNVGEKPSISRHRMLSTVGWRIGSKKCYALEGSVFIAGAVTQWLRDGLEIISSAAEIEPLAKTVPDNGGIYMVPAFAGLGAPHWDAYARGCIFGITRGTSSGHFARAALESIAFQVADVLDAMRLDSGQSISELRVDGGACKNNLLLQFQADILGATVIRPTVIETTALGAAYLAGLAVGFWKSETELLKQSQIDQAFEPSMSRDQAMALRRRWDKALSRSMSWEDA